MVILAGRVMICKKCKKYISLGTKCFQCGYENSSELPGKKQAKAYKKTPVLIAVMALFVVVDVVKIIVNIGIFFDIWVLSALLDKFYRLTGLSIRSWVIPKIFEILPISLAKLPYQVFYLIQIPFLLGCIGLLYLCMAKLKKWTFNVYVGLTFWSAIVQLSRYSVVPFILKFLLLTLVYIFDVRRWGKTVSKKD